MKKELDKLAKEYNIKIENNSLNRLSKIWTEYFNIKDLNGNDKYGIGYCDNQETCLFYTSFGVEPFYEVSNHDCPRFDTIEEAIKFEEKEDKNV